MAEIEICEGCVLIVPDEQRESAIENYTSAIRQGLIGIDPERHLELVLWYGPYLHRPEMGWILRVNGVDFEQQ